MKTIASFTVDHEKLLTGLYVSRVDMVGAEAVTTFDLRMTRPNQEPVMDTAAIHTIEHLGAQNADSIKHMICAIFQYCGSTTINGGTISTPNYRSARLWKGDMTINGGNFDGQLWVQAVDNTAKLIINGGTFAPSPGDGSSVYITNAGYDVAFAVTGGYFNTKIGCYDANALAGAITGGTFTESAKTNTKAELLATGYQFVANGDGTYDVKK